jgi:hypothetical protein
MTPSSIQSNTFEMNYVNNSFITGLLKALMLWKITCVFVLKNLEDNPIRLKSIVV